MGSGNDSVVYMKPRDKIVENTSPSIISEETKREETFGTAPVGTV